MNYTPNYNDQLSYTGAASKTEAISLLSQLLPADADQEILRAFVEHLLSSAAYITNRVHVAPLAAQVTVGGRAIALLRAEFPEYSDAELDGLMVDLVANCIAALKESEAAEQKQPDPRAAKASKK